MRRKEARQGKSYGVDKGLQEAMSGKPTDSQEFEGRVIIVLVSVFLLCILEGLALAASVRHQLCHRVLMHS